MKRSIVIFSLLLIPVICQADFYVKVTEQQSQTLIQEGIANLWGRNVRRFKKYTFFVEDQATGDRYYKVENLTYDDLNGNLKTYDIIGWLNNHYPSLPHYTEEFVNQFLPESEIP